MPSSDQNLPTQHDEETSSPQFQYPHNRQPNGQAQTSGKAVASMVLGICSIVTCMMYGIPGMVCGILAVVFSKHAMNNITNGTAPQTSAGMAKAGRICGWIGISLNTLMLLFILVYIVIIIGIFGVAAAGAANSPTLLPF